MTQTGIPASGLYGPGDYGHIITIEEIEAEEQDAFVHCRNDIQASLEMELVERKAIRDCLLDLAHDLDARGLVLVDEHEHEWTSRVAYEAVKADALNPFEPLPPDPNTGS